MSKKIWGFIITFALFIGLPNVLAVNHKNDVNEEGIYTITLSGDYNYNYVDGVLELVNMEREKEGLAPLELDATLTELAMTRSRESSLYWSHTRPNGTSWSTILNGHIGSFGENIAVNYFNPTDVMTAWMNSDGHRKNILTPEWKSIGIGYFKIGSNVFWCQLFSSNEAISPVEKTGIVHEENGIVEVLEQNINFDVIWPNTEALTVKVDEELSPTRIKLVNVANQAILSGSKTDFKWESSNPDVFTVDESGTITGKGIGTATLTVSIGNLKKEFEISVSADLKAIEINEELEFHKGESTNLTLSYLPVGATIPDDIKVVWSSSNTEVARVDESGKVTAVGVGTATITARIGSVETSKVVTVYSALSGDVNEDGNIDVMDIFEVLKTASRKLNFRGFRLNHSDFNRNHYIDIGDIFAITYRVLFAK